MADFTRHTERKVTLADIAGHSGVSPATVSLVLRNKPGVGASTRQRVLDSAQALGYIPVPSNQSLQRKALKTIGVIVKSRADDHPDKNPFYAPVLAGIDAICRSYQINLRHAAVPVDAANHPLTTPDLLLDKTVDGLLIVGVSLDETMETHLIDSGAPVVLVDSYAVHQPFDSVVTDNEAGAFAATEHLIALGHRNIAILGSRPDAYPSVLERRKGYLNAINTHHLTAHYADCYLYPDFVDAAVRSLLAHTPDISAIFACNDDLAIEAMTTLRTLGKRLPHAVSIVGFDNIDAAQHTTPSLTTMRVDVIGMGRIAAQLLLNRADAPESGHIRAVIQPDFVLRNSTVAPAF